jgi:hypothetical protein
MMYMVIGNKDLHVQFDTICPPAARTERHLVDLNIQKEVEWQKQTCNKSKIVSEQSGIRTHARRLAIRLRNQNLKLAR